MKTNGISEKQLITALSSKDQKAWKQFYGDLSPILMSLAMRYVKDYDCTRDVLQNSFLKMFHNMEKFSYQGEGSLRAWATRIVINEALAAIKKNEREDFFANVEEFPDFPEEEISVSHLSESDIMQLIQSLPTGYRTVFNLYVIEKKSHSEIAAILDIEENSSASQFHRAKKMLAQKINEVKLQKLEPYER